MPGENHARQRLPVENSLHGNTVHGVELCMIAMRVVQAAFSIPIIVCYARGQSISPPKTFDVASIKPYGAQDGNFMIRTQPDGTFRAVGATLKMLIMFAYNVKA